MKVLTFVLRNSLGDTTNMGLSSKVNQVELHYDYDESEIKDMPDDDLVLIKAKFGWSDEAYMRAVPVSVLKSKNWYMFGGNYISTSDSRFPARYPIPVFDRVE